jgi:hypothetical protein
VTGRTDQFAPGFALVRRGRRGAGRRQRGVEVLQGRERALERAAKPAERDGLLLHDLIVEQGGGRVRLSSRETLAGRALRHAVGPRSMCVPRLDGAINIGSDR